MGITRVRREVPRRRGQSRRFLWELGGSFACAVCVCSGECCGLTVPMRASSDFNTLEPLLLLALTTGQLWGVG